MHRPGCGEAARTSLMSLRTGGLKALCPRPRPRPLSRFMSLPLVLASLALCLFLSNAKAQSVAPPVAHCLGYEQPATQWTWVCRMCAGGEPAMQTICNAPDAELEGTKRL